MRHREEKNEKIEERAGEPQRCEEKAQCAKLRDGEGREMGMPAGCEVILAEKYPKPCQT